MPSSIGMPNVFQALAAAVMGPTNRAPDLFVDDFDPSAPLPDFPIGCESAQVCRCERWNPLLTANDVLCIWLQ